MNDATNYIGVRELRNHFSAYLSRVKEGETFIVTEHGKAIATLIPKSDRTWLETQIEAGLVRSPKNPFK